MPSTGQCIKNVLGKNVCLVPSHNEHNENYVLFNENNEQITKAHTTH